MLMTRSVKEYFTNAPPTDIMKMSPALLNMMAAPALAEKIPPLQVDTLAREKDLKRSTENKCPSCPVCPDMSQYIKLDEIPCWNCSLP